MIARVLTVFGAVSFIAAVLGLVAYAVAWLFRIWEDTNPRGGGL